MGLPALKPGVRDADEAEMIRQALAAGTPVTRAVESNGAGRPEALVESYRRLAEVFHEVLSEQALDGLLVRIAETLADLMPYEALHIYEADERRRRLIPILARSAEYEEEMGRGPGCSEARQWERSGMVRRAGGGMVGPLSTTGARSTDPTFLCQALLYPPTA